MAITNLGTLQDAVESWLERSFTDALFLEFAAQVTDKLHRGVLAPDNRMWIVPPLRSRLMLTTTTLTPSSGVEALPADWLEFERLWVDTDAGMDLVYVPKNQFWSDPRSRQTGTPSIYTIDDENVRFGPTTDNDVECTYFQTLTALTGDAITNVILTAHPNVYLRGCLAEAWGWIGGNEAREDRETQNFANAVRGLNQQRKQAQTSGSMLLMRPGSVA